MRFLSRNIGLGIKLNLLVLVVLVLLLVSVVLLLTSNTRNLTEEIGGGRIAEESAIMERRLAEIERELSLEIRFLAANPRLFDAVANQDQNAARTAVTLATSTLQIDDIDLIDANGNRLAQVRPNEDTTAEDALFALALLGIDKIDLIVEEGTEGPEVSIAAVVPIIDSTGAIIGALQMSRRVDDVFLEALDFQRTAVGLQLLYNNQVLARSGSAQKGIDFEAAPFQQAQNGQTVVVDNLVEDNEGIPYSIAYTPLLPNAENSPAVIMILVRLEEIASFQDSTLFTTILIFATLTVIAIIIIYIATYRVVILPLHNLEAAAQNMAGGQYDQRAPEGSQDEIGQLARTFNKMVDAIHERETSLQEARDRAERSDQVKSAFLASMSHELRTPLNAVINFTKFVAKGDLGPVNERQEETLNEVISSGRHLLNLINDVLDMSKIESGSLRLFVDDNVDLNALLESVVSTSKGLLADKSVELRTEIDPDLPHIRGDRQRILQILLNVISNACKFTDEGYVKIRASQSDGEIVIHVEDTGPGIAPEDQAAVFEPFKQTSSGLRKGGGTGLGMPISRNLAEAHGGRLWVDSEVGKGSNFCIALPIRAKHLTPTLTTQGAKV